MRTTIVFRARLTREFFLLKQMQRTHSGPVLTNSCIMVVYTLWRTGFSPFLRNIRVTYDLINYSKESTYKRKKNN